MKYTFFLTLLFSLLFAIISFGQQPVKNKTGLGANDISTLNKKIDSIFKSFNQQTPGVAVNVPDLSFNLMI